LAELHRAPVAVAAKPVNVAVTAPVPASAVVPAAADATLSGVATVSGAACITLNSACTGTATTNGPADAPVAVAANPVNANVTAPVPSAAALFTSTLPALRTVPPV